MYIPYIQNVCFILKSFAMKNDAINSCQNFVKTATNLFSLSRVKKRVLLFLTFLIFGVSEFYGQCPSNYQCISHNGDLALTVEFEAGNAAADQTVACDFVVAHGGVLIGGDETDCSGGSFTIDGITYNFISDDGGGNGNITLTYSSGIPHDPQDCPANYDIAESIGCGQTSDDGCLRIIFQDIETGQNCNSSNSYFSMTLEDVGNCGPYTLVAFGNSDIFNLEPAPEGTGHTIDEGEVLTGGVGDEYFVDTIKAGTYILIFTDNSDNEHTFTYNHITQNGSCVTPSDLLIDKTITSGDPFSTVGDIINYQYAVSLDSGSADITDIIVTDDKIGDLTVYTGDDGDDILETGETWIFTGSYTITAADIVAEFVTNVAFAKGLTDLDQDVFSDVDTETAVLLPCTLAATCDLTEIEIKGCDIPDALTSPDDVFLDIESCGATVTMSSSDDGDTDICGDGDGASFTRTYTLFFDDVEFTTCEQFITVNDNTPPTINCPVDPIDLDCNPTLPTTGDAEDAVITDDNCGVKSVVATAGDITGDCTKTQVFNVVVTDNCDNTANCNVTYTWTEDSTPPVITCPSTGLDLGCNPDSIPDASNVIAASSVDDDCSATITSAVSTNGVEGDGCEKSQTWLVTATDDCGDLTDTCEVTYTWTEDSTPPVITCPTTGLDLGCNPDSIPDATDVIAASSVSDNCGATITSAVSTNGVEGDDCEKSQTWLVTATDDCGDLTDTCEVTYTWTEDDTAPSETSDIQDKDLGCNPDSIAFDTPSFDGDCSDVEAVDGFPSLGTEVVDGCNHSQTKTWKVTDCSELETTMTQTLSWTEDDNAPSETSNIRDKDLGCNPDSIAFDSPTFDGDCSDVEVVDGFPSLGTEMIDGCNHSQTKTWKVTDCSDLETTVTQTLSWTEDDTAPSETSDIQDKDLGCNPDSIAFDTPTFDGDCSDVEAVDGFPSLGTEMIDGCNHSQTKTWKVTDCSELETTVTQTLSWTEDDTAPSEISDIQNKDLGCNPDSITFDTPTFDGECSDVEAVDGFPSLGSEMIDGCDHSQTKTWKVTDCSNLETTVTQTLSWTEDDNAPSETSNVQDKDLGCNPDSIIFDTPTFEGDCSDVEAVDGFPSLGTEMVDGCNHSQTKTWKVTDCSELETTVTQTLSWTEDDTAPSETSDIQDKDLDCNPDGLIFDTPTFDGGCSGVEVVDGFPSIGDEVVEDCIHSITKTWKVTDCSDLETTITQTLFWTETQTPKIYCNYSENTDLGCNPSDADIPSGQSLIDDGYITATDGCSGESQGVTLDRTERLTNGCERSLTYYYKTYDLCPHSTPKEDSCSVTFYWEEDEPINCEIAYAKNKEFSDCFLTDDKIDSNLWGWTTYYDSPGQYILLLYAGAEECGYSSNGTNVGYVVIDYTGSEVTIVYILYQPYVMSEVNAFIGCDSYPLDGEGMFTADPALYNYNSGPLEYATQYTIGPVNVENTNGIHVITQAVTCVLNCDCLNLDYNPDSYPLNDENNFIDCEDASLSTASISDSPTFEAYPVPFKNDLFINYKFYYETDVIIEVFDIKGALLKRRIDRNYNSGSKAETSIDFRGLSDQLYFIKLTTNKGTGIKKVVSN